MVTKLGEFSPIGRLFSMGSFVKITEVTQFLAQFLLRKKPYIRYVIMAKNGLGYIFGHF
jgi:hypothetical protein